MDTKQTEADANPVGDDEVRAMAKSFSGHDEAKERASVLATRDALMAHPTPEARTAAFLQLSTHTKGKVFGVLPSSVRLTLMAAVPDEEKAALLEHLPADVRDGLLDLIPESTKVAMLQAMPEMLKIRTLYAIMGGNLNKLKEDMLSTDDNSEFHQAAARAMAQFGPTKTAQFSLTSPNAGVGGELELAANEDSDAGEQSREDLVQAMALQRDRVNFLKNQLEEAEDELALLDHKLRRHDRLNRLESFSVSLTSEDEDSFNSNDSQVDGVTFTGATPTSRKAEELDTLAAELRDPLKGVKIGRHTVRMKAYHHVFVGSEAVDWVLDHNKAATRLNAAALLQRLFEHGHFKNVPGGHFFEDANNRYYRFPRELPAHLSLKLVHASNHTCTRLLESVLELVQHVHEGTVEQWLDPSDPTKAQFYLLRTGYPAVLLWAKLNPSSRGIITSKLFQIVSRYPVLRLSLTGFTRAHGGACMCPAALSKQVMQSGCAMLTDYEQATFRLVTAGRPGKVGRKFEKEGTLVAHPFTDETGLRVEVKKVFTSAAKPAWLRFWRDPDESKGEEEPVMVSPDVVAKAGDDLRKDLAVQLIFKAFEAVWASEDVQWRLGQAPYIKTYNILVAGEAAGFLEFVKGSVIKDIEEEGKWKDVNLQAFSPSAVGSMVAGFVLGVRDRHSENWMVVGDLEKNPELMQIDFGYMLMENPGGFPLDTPRLTMQASLVSQLKKTEGLHGNLLDDFRADMVTAYGVLRKHHASLISFIKVVLSSIYDMDKVDHFLRGKHSFRSDQTERQAMEWFDEKVHSQLSRFNIRRGAKHALVKGFYAFQKLTGGF